MLLPRLESETRKRKERIGSECCTATHSDARDKCWLPGNTLCRFVFALSRNVSALNCKRRLKKVALSMGFLLLYRAFDKVQNSFHQQMHPLLNI
jgi:hypothetical protein